MSLTFATGCTHSHPVGCRDADPVAAAASPAVVDTEGATAVRGVVDAELDLRHAGPRRVRLAYETLGAATLPAVFVAGGISAHRHVAGSSAFADSGWWEAQVGSGRALDPNRQRIVAFDWLGSDGALDVPLDPSDQADAIAALLDALAVQRLAGFVGCSYGAMVGLQFAARHPDRLAHLVAISGSHRADPYASAWRALQRRAVALGALQCDETHGLDLARQLAILSYRTPGEFASRFGAARIVNGRVRVAAEDYLDHCGAKYAANTPPTAFLRLSESIDLHAIDPATVRTPVTVVGVVEDRLVPIADAYELAQQLRGETTLCVLRSLYGHDAFLKEHARIATILSDSLREPLRAAGNPAVSS